MADADEVTPPDDPALAALDRLLAALDEAERDFAAVRDRAAVIREARAEGRPFRELVPEETRPLAVQLMTQIQDRLAVAGAEWRREEARALHREGMSMERIAALFGVTRQRVGALLSGGPSGRE